MVLQPGVQRVDYADELGVERAKAVLDWWFEKHVDVVPLTGCWQSRFSCNVRGYTRVRLQGWKPKSARKCFLLHRVAFVASRGRDIREDMVASHLCSNKSCVRPEHIVEETSAENLRRSRVVCLGRIVCGECGLILARTCAHSPGCLGVYVVDHCVRDTIVCAPLLRGGVL